MDDWQLVMYASVCDPDGTGWCEIRDCDVCDCSCFGPSQDDLEYKTIDGVLYARKIAAS